MSMSQIEELSDEELYANLKALGLSRGAIADSTRHLYRTLLFDTINAPESKEELPKIVPAAVMEEKPKVKTPKSQSRSRSATPAVNQVRDSPPSEVPLAVYPKIVATMSTSTPVDDSTTNVKRRHTFTRWNMLDDGDQQLASPYRASDDDDSYHMRYGAVKEVNPKKNGKGMWVFFMIGLLIIAALAALYFVGGEVDQYKQIEEDAEKLANTASD